MDTLHSTLLKRHELRTYISYFDMNYVFHFHHKLGNYALYSRLGSFGI
jgi:hypothetical protein